MNPRPNSTRANIGILEGKNVRWVYLHDHGRADEILVEHYNTVPRINQLLALGNLSAIGSKIGKRHSFEYEDRPRDTVTAYHRDRGDELDPPTVTPVREYGTDPMIDYHYLFRDGQWIYRRPSGQWKFAATDKPVAAPTAKKAPAKTRKPTRRVKPAPQGQRSFFSLWSLGE